MPHSWCLKRCPSPRFVNQPDSNSPQLVFLGLGIFKIPSLQFPVLYSRTLLFIHSKCNSLHLPTPNLPVYLSSSSTQPLEMAVQACREPVATKFPVSTKDYKKPARTFIYLFFKYLVCCSGSQLPQARSLVVTYGQLVVACGIQFLEPGLNAGPLHWEHGVLATGLPGKFLLGLVRIIKGWRSFHLENKRTVF